jgi:hypothetical protein
LVFYQPILVKTSNRWGLFVLTLLLLPEPLNLDSPRCPWEGTKDREQGIRQAKEAASYAKRMAKRITNDRKNIKK